MNPMALSVKQPWASLIVEGVKDIENRTWRTNRRGPLFIHASKQWSRHEYSHLYGEPKEFVFGAIVGIVDLIDCVTKHESEWFEGPYGFVFARPMKFQNPIPYEGRLRFFTLEINPQRLRWA